MSLLNIFKSFPTKVERDNFEKGEDLLIKTFGDPLYTIRWIRHAESCSNYARGNLTDKADLLDPSKKKYLGYGKDIILDETSNNSYMKPIIKTNIESLKETPSRDLQQYMLDIMSSTKSLVYEPNLSFIGMSQAINLSSYINKIHDNVDIFISSPMTRTIMTALISLRYQNLIKSITVYICPFINEFTSVDFLDINDYQNKAVPSTTLIKRILFIKDWMERNWISSYDDIEVIDDLITIYDVADKDYKDRLTKIFNCRKNKNKTTCNTDNETNIVRFINDFITNKENIDSSIQVIKDFITKYTLIMDKDNFVKFKRGPEINYDIYKYYEEIEPKITLKTDYNKFLSEVIPYIQQTPSYNNPKKFVIYSHGLFIKDIWKVLNLSSYKFYEEELQHLMNTQVLKHEKYSEYNYFRLDNSPVKIRDSYFNFEEYNQNVCRKQSVKGVINYKFAEIKPSNLEPYPKEQMDNDVRFVYEEEQYKIKYLKYKQKYLKLKPKSINK
jgi:hypothetical protein